MTNIAMKIFKENPEAITPTYGTRFAACFDLSACLKGVETVKVFNKKNEVENVKVNVDEDGNAWFTLNKGCRALVPTGIIFDIPNYLSLRIHPRSGISLKHGITLVNAEAVIDPDYVEQTFIALMNVSDVPFRVNHGDRVAQGEFVEDANRVSTVFVTPYRPKQVGDRLGGLGSTGI